MSFVDLSLRPYRCLLYKWANDSYDDPWDITDLIVSFTFGYEGFSQSGIERQTGRVEILGYPFVEPAESINPRRNPTRWRQGNKLVVELFWENAWTPLKTAYILQFPLPAYPGSPIMQLEIGCLLSLLSYRVPPSTTEEETGVKLGTPTATQTVVEGLLAAAGIEALGGTIAGTLDFSPEKDLASSWIEEAGKIAYAFGSYLRCNAEGAVVAVPIPQFPGMVRSRLFQLGRDEAQCVPIAETVNPPAKFLLTSVKTEVTPTPNETTTVQEEYGPSRMFDLNADPNGICLARQVITKESGLGVRSRFTLIKEPRGAVFPFESEGRLMLTTSQVEDETWHYGGGDDGRLYKRSLFVRRPKSAALAEYYGGAGIGPKAITTVSRESTSYQYDSQEGASKITNLREELAASVCPKEFYALGKSDEEAIIDGIRFDDLVPSGGQREEWNGSYKSDRWVYEKRQYDNAKRKYDLKFAPIGAKLANLVVAGERVSSNTGGAQPSQAERRSPLYVAEDIPIEAEILLEPIGGSAFSVPEETIDIPYCQTEKQLLAAGQPLAVLAVAKQLGIQWQTGIDDYWINDPDPIARLDLIEPDGTVDAYVMDSLSIAFDQSRLYVGGNAYWLGQVDVLTPDPAAEPGETPGAGGDRIRPPYQDVIIFAAIEIEQGMIIARPYDLKPPPIEFAAIEIERSIFRLREYPDIEFESSEAEDGGVDFIESIAGLEWEDGVFEFDEDNFTQPSLTARYSPTVDVTVYEDVDNYPGYPNFVFSWDNQADPPGGSAEGQGYGYSDPYWVADAFGAGLPGIEFNPVEPANYNQYCTLGDGVTAAEDLISTTAFTAFVVVKLRDWTTHPSPGSSVPNHGTPQFDGGNGIFGVDGTFDIRMRYINDFSDPPYYEIALWHQDGSNSGNGVEIFSVATAEVNLLISAWHEAGELYLQVNNGAIAQITSGTTIIDFGATLLFGSISNTCAPCIVGEALLYNASLPEATREAIQADLNDIYEFWS